MGNFFLEHADRILDEVRLAQKHMKKLSGNAGHVDIGYVFPLAAHYIPHTVRRFLSTQKNKDVTFNFHQSHTGEMIRGLKNEKYDVIFGSYVEDEPDIQFVPILNQEMIIITLLATRFQKKSRFPSMIWNITRSSVMIVLPVLDALPAGLILPIHSIRISSVNPRMKTPLPLLLQKILGLPLLRMLRSWITSN